MLKSTIPKYQLLSLLMMTYLPSTVFAHSGHIHDEAVQACTSKALGERCNYTVADAARYKGSCQMFESGALCVRNEPIEYLSPPAFLATDAVSSNVKPDMEEH